MFDTSGNIDGYNEFRPESPYAVSKVAAVLYGEYMYRAYGLPVVTVIPTNTYGRAFVNQRHFFIEKVITELLTGKRELFLGNPDAVRDWMFRDDHVNAYVSVIKAVLNGRDGVVGGRFAFGTGDGFTTRETADLIRSLLVRMLCFIGVVMLGLLRLVGLLFRGVLLRGLGVCWVGIRGLICLMVWLVLLMSGVGCLALINGF
jgi:dTDP-D-glucose 4,6-dehydratase